MLRVLDLFSGAGGAATGIHQALEEAKLEHEIVGVDIKPQPRYPFKFVLGDAMTFLLGGWSFIWCSPPCQGYSSGRYWVRGHNGASEHPRLIEKLRIRLYSMLGNRDWVIENVQGAPLHNPVMLCGSMFGLNIAKGYLRRHRLFEALFPIKPLECAHGRQAISVCGHGAGGMWGYRKANAAEARELLGIDWMNRDELAEAIPPAYSRYIMQQWLSGRL